MRIEGHGNDGEPVFRAHIDGSFQDVLMPAMHTVEVTDGHRGGCVGRPHARRRGVTPYTGVSGIVHAESLKLGLSSWVFQTGSFKLGLSNWVFHFGTFALVFLLTPSCSRYHCAACGPSPVPGRYSSGLRGLRIRSLARSPSPRRFQS